MTSINGTFIISKSSKKKEVKTILTKRGYSIIKSLFTEDEIAKIKSDLTVKPFVNEDFGPGVQPYPIYLESDNKLYLSIITS